MSTARAALACAAAAAALAAAGCGGGAPAPRQPDDAARTAPVTERAAPSGYFVAADDRGLGASVDLAGFDPTALRVSRALLARGEPAALGIVSLVNGGSAPVRVPRLLATDLDGREVPMVDVRYLLATARTPVARAARRALGPPVTRIPAGGSRVVYMVAPGLDADRVAAVTMTTGTKVVEMRAQRR